MVMARKTWRSGGPPPRPSGFYSPATSTVTTKQLGLSTDVPVPSDYDGDGKTDFAVWRPSTGVWTIVQSSNEATVTGQWGASTDVPVPGDYDGDGKTDYAIWRPASGNWMIFKSSGGTLTMQWGTLGDVPVPGDYDGDGKTDLAIWRAATATFWIYNSASSSITSKQWGRLDRCAGAERLRWRSQDGHRGLAALDRSIGLSSKARMDRRRTCNGGTRRIFRCQEITMAMARRTSPSGAPRLECGGFSRVLTAWR